MGIPSASEPLELSGLDGANPLGFLAALGTLVTLRQAGHDRAKLGWRRSVTWIPVLNGVSTNDPMTLSQSLAEFLRGKPVPEDAVARREATQRDFVAAKKAVKDKRDEIKRGGLRGSERKTALEVKVAPLEEVLRRKRQAWLSALKDAVPRPELAIGKHIDCADDEYRAHATGFLEEAGFAQRETLDLLAAFGSDACIDGRSRRITPTPFCFITGSGHQYFLDTVRQLMEVMSTEYIYATLFKPWTYRDKGLSMRWDPIEDRRYALMDRDPTAHGNESRTVWMANLLAYRALILFPSAPKGRHLATTAWSSFGNVDNFTWPIWEHPVELDTIRSILQLPEISAQNPDRFVLSARGIVTAFRARRVQVGNPPLHKINFGPAGGVY